MDPSRPWKGGGNEASAKQWRVELPAMGHFLELAQRSESTKDENYNSPPGGKICVPGKSQGLSLIKSVGAELKT